MTLVRRDTWTLDGPDGLPIHGETDLPSEPLGVVAVIVHGYTGSKDRNIIPTMGVHLADAGVTCHRFTMSHSGFGKDADEITMLDAFERDSAAICMQNIEIVLRASSGGDLPGGGDRFVLIGHSRGAANVLGYAGRPLDDAPRPEAIVCLAVIDNFWHCTPEIESALRTNGFVAREFGRTDAGFLRMGPSWFEHAVDAASPTEEFDRRLQRIDAPVLLVHGESDANVPRSQPERIRSVIESGGRSPRVELTTIPGGDHNFNALGFGVGHDNIDAPAARSAATAVIEFIRSL